jgi:starvation-inducible DNA-binding protein
MEKLNQLARIAFASEFSFYMKTHAFHWNVEGRDFFEYHKLFETIYQEVLDHIDDFAEKLRSIAIYTPYTHQTLSMLSKVEDENYVPAKDQMVTELLMDNEKMLIILKKTYDAAEAAGEHGFSNFLAERMDAHRKHGWFLRASSKQD